MTVIIGAGMAGLLAAALDRRAQVYEAQPSLPHNHHAVLRFREDKIARALDIPFRRVRVLKGVDGSRGAIRDANAYSLKVTGRLSARSILNLEPAERWIAPKDFIPRLAELCEGRLHFGVKIGRDRIAGLRAEGERIISTAPLPRMLEALEGFAAVDPDEFKFSSVTVRKFIVPESDVFQTVYFPYGDNDVYRATLTGEELLMESMEEDISIDSVARTLAAFHLDLWPVQIAETDRQALGKIVPLPDARRKALLLHLTVEHGVFSLGRYACWRNILLDDVFSDYFKIKQLMDLDSAYDFRKHVS